jgi:hypothetical protein
MSSRATKQFRVVIDSSSPRADADALRKAGFELVGPWAAGNASAERLVEDEHAVSALLREDSVEGATETVKAVIGSKTGIQVIPVR